MKILITGKNSYIGNALKDYLSGDKTFEIETISLRTNAWKNVDLSQYDSIFHVAGIAHNKKNSKHNPLYFAVNRDLTLALAKEAKQAKVKQFIYMSSAIIFGKDTKPNNDQFIDVSQPNPIGVYAKSKYEADTQLSELNSVDFNVVNIRAPIVYGPNCKGNFPQLIHWAHLFYWLPKMDNQRSMVYIDNLNELIKLIFLNQSKGLFYPQNERYISTNEIIEYSRLAKGLKTRYSKSLGMLLRAFICVPILKKVYGDKKYAHSDSAHFDNQYQVVKTSDSIKQTIQSFLGSQE